MNKVNDAVKGPVLQTGLFLWLYHFFQYDKICRINFQLAAISKTNRFACKDIDIVAFQAACIKWKELLFF